ncbi:MAG: C25 family cysteine peptidase [Elusimicrobia bacterium]|nr:C25 family cysteine peptidase [Candidatus Obscuribacterium magneticum]
MKINAIYKSKILNILIAASVVLSTPAVPVSAQEAPLSLPGPGPYDYVIITSNALKDSFQPLIDRKISKGLTAAIVTTEYIYANYTGTENNDNADKIRSFIRDSYLNRGTQWVLLGGDVEVVPARGVFAQVGTDIQNNLPSDMYYACLDGPWNGDGDSLWGEYGDGADGGEIDMVPEVYLGRAPVSNTTEAANFVAKTIQYETSSHPNSSTVVLLAEKADSLTWGSSSMIAIRDATLPNTWNLVERYDTPSYTFQGSLVISDLNASPNMVASSGHASPTTDSRITTTDVGRLTNAFPYFMYSQGCNAGSFDTADVSIAEKHVVSAHGAFAVVMNARTGWYQSGSAPGYSHDFALGFFDAVFNEGKEHLGEANGDSKVDILLSRGGLGGIYRYVYFETNLFGDPETEFQLSVGVTNTITATAGSGGSISPVGVVSVNSGASQAFTITPDTGYHIVGVTIDGVPNGVISTYAFSNVTSNHTISATFAINDTPTNQSPQVDAGGHQTVTLAAGATLHGIVIDDGLPNPPSTITSSWSQLSGPGTVTFQDASLPTTTVQFSSTGTYVLQLTASDSVLSGSATVTIIVASDVTTNQPPLVSAGANQTIDLFAAASLSGSASDDGLPNPPGRLTTAWTKATGPGTVAFADASALATTATFSAPGVYTLRLTATDSQFASSNDLTITVTVNNQAPAVDAGNNIILTFPDPAPLIGSVSDDGLPNPPRHLTIAWTKVSGPGAVMFDPPASLSTTASFSEPGVYLLRLSANDGALASQDDLQVTVDERRMTGEGPAGINVIHPSISSEIEINFELEEPMHVTIQIYGRDGLVRALVDADTPAGSHRAIWDGRNGQGERVASGIYRVILNLGGKKLTKKVAVLR